MSKTDLADALHQHFADNPSRLTKGELYDKAKELDIAGRSKMDKDELADAVDDARE